MKKLLIIGDVHQKVATVNSALSRESEADQTIFMGDYFDDFDDNAYEVEAMAHWLKESLTKPNRIHLMGNHDLQYMLPQGSIFCSGFASWKHDIISKILTPEDWSKLEYFHHVKGVREIWFSHAGITKYWFEHPVLGTTVEHIQEVVLQSKDCLKRLNTGCSIAALYAADRLRGGRYPKGGLLWNDWRNIDHFENTIQIVGHTPYDKIQIQKKEEIRSMCINVDTHLNEVLLFDLENESLEVIRNN
jgi:hypothetical protein